jgi:glutaminyl-peptide cyclotransferase
MQIRLADFIRAEVEPILRDWEAVARTILPARHMGKTELRDHARDMLLEIADDLDSHQSKSEQAAKSKGQEPIEQALAEERIWHSAHHDRPPGCPDFRQHRDPVLPSRCVLWGRPAGSCGPCHVQRQELGRQPDLVLRRVRLMRRIAGVNHLAIAALLGLAALGGCSDSPVEAGPVDGGILSSGVEFYTYRVIDEYPHDPTAFTQGLVLDDGVLFESTGLHGQSSLRRVELETGIVLQRHDLAPEYFGEGITTFGDRIIQLTWRSRTGFVYDRESLAPQREFSYETEGWGLTDDGTRLIMSDGTASLHFLDPFTFSPLSSVPVTWRGAPVDRLNELEYIEGHVFANVWLTDRIAVIDPEDGSVVAWIDLSGLLPPEDRAGADVLNGIAFDAQAGRLLVTGKLWPTLFEIELVPEG